MNFKTITLLIGLVTTTVFANNPLKFSAIECFGDQNGGGHIKVYIDNFFAQSRKVKFAGHGAEALKKMGLYMFESQNNFSAMPLSNDERRSRSGTDNIWTINGWSYYDNNGRDISTTGEIYFEHESWAGAIKEITVKVYANSTDGQLQNEFQGQYTFHNCKPTMIH